MIEYSEKYQDDTFEYRCVPLCPGCTWLLLSLLRWREQAAGLAPNRQTALRGGLCTGTSPALSLTPILPPSPLSDYFDTPLCSHVILPKELAKSLQPKRLLAEAEWRALGVQQSRGWSHYAIHRPEPHILLFRRELGTDPMTGKVNPVLRQQAIEANKAEYNK